MAKFTISPNKFNLTNQVYSEEIKDRNLRTIVTSLQNLGLDLNSIPFLDGRLIEGIILPNAGSLSFDVEHGLGRPWSGWWIVSNNAENRIITEESTGQTDPNRYITMHINVLVGGITKIIDMWVF